MHIILVLVTNLCDKVIKVISKKLGDTPMVDCFVFDLLECKYVCMLLF